MSRLKRPLVPTRPRHRMGHTLGRLSCGSASGPRIIVFQTEAPSEFYLSSSSTPLRCVERTGEVNRQTQRMPVTPRGREEPEPGAAGALPPPVPLRWFNSVVLALERASAFPTACVYPQVAGCHGQRFCSAGRSPRPLSPVSSAQKG